MEIIFGITHQSLRSVARRWPLDVEKQRRMSIIEEGPEKHIRMAHLAIVGSHAVNGVSRLHTELLKTVLVPDFAHLWPERFSNKTNGVAPRRWILKANPRLAGPLTRTVGGGRVTGFEQGKGVEKNGFDGGVHQKVMEIKRQ